MLERTSGTAGIVSANGRRRSRPLGPARLGWTAGHGPPLRAGRLEERRHFLPRVAAVMTHEQVCRLGAGVQCSIVKGSDVPGLASVDACAHPGPTAVP